MSNIVERLVGVAEFVVGEPRAALYEAVKEIERLRSLTRFQDGVIRSGDVACLTAAEREALHHVVGDVADITGPVEDAIRGLLERMK